MKHPRDKRIQATNERFDQFRRENPGATFKDFYASLVKNQLLRGQAHATLGGNLKKGEFGDSGRDVLQDCLHAGLSPSDTVVDYGCGTLRMGVHIVPMLSAGAYWGMDIDEFLLDEGKQLLGDALLAEKRPNLGIISPEFVARAAEAKPTFLLSISVLIHVHPDELDEYFDNIAKLVVPQGRAFLTAKCVDGTESPQYSGRSWAHGIKRLENGFRERGLKLAVLDSFETDQRADGAVIMRMNLIAEEPNRSMH
jgi:SAM-dependent methyltransferase